jgi:hypothetical protein
MNKGSLIRWKGTAFLRRGHGVSAYQKAELIQKYFQLTPFPVTSISSLYDGRINEYCYEPVRLLV